MKEIILGGALVASVAIGGIAIAQEGPMTLDVASDALWKVMVILSAAGLVAGSGEGKES